MTNSTTFSARIILQTDTSSIHNVYGMPMRDIEWIHKHLTPTYECLDEEGEHAIYSLTEISASISLREDSTPLSIIDVHNQLGEYYFVRFYHSNI